MAKYYKIELERNEVKIIADCLRVCSLKWADSKTKSIREKGLWASKLDVFFRMIARKRKREEF